MHALDYFFALWKLKNKDVAEYLGIPAPQINDWKKGRRPIPKHHLEKLCELFSIPPEKSYLLQKESLTKIDRLEIEIILNQAKLKNFVEGDDEQINKAIRITFEMNIAVCKRNIEVLKILDQLEKELMGCSHVPQLFYKNLEKVKCLIEEIKSEM
ncbi:helix-turn-helix transcriptional regulator [Anoxybacillus sp. ST4]|uniref:helix-turn-helix domain-containing protein n=1 Tax=Anoxybacillus sp. ST4 TaxID=2864181 RepID=UPI001C63BEAA|nr:helix-turn-helix transcriptional regulator [Anoxybacillus sp. ST4]MBW7649814.1 helix-turn-helix domain-containing protein [Anoxybacillus sp. ST4]